MTNVRRKTNVGDCHECVGTEEFISDVGWHRKIVTVLGRMEDVGFCHDFVEDQRDCVEPEEFGKSVAGGVEKMCRTSCIGGKTRYV